MDETIVPKNRWGGYDIAIKVIRQGNEFRTYLMDAEGGDRYSLIDFQTLMRGREARLDFPYWVGNLKVSWGPEKDEIVFQRFGERMSYGELVEFLKNNTDFKLA